MKKLYKIAFLSVVKKVCLLLNEMKGSCVLKLFYAKLHFYKLQLFSNTNQCQVGTEEFAPFWSALALLD
jgi:hypothetical protein